MGLVTTMGKYCFIKCDGPHCSKKIEHLDPEQVKQLARLCDWQSYGDRWICPACAKKLDEEMLPRKRKGRALPRKEGTSAAK
jgi:hypothetical protein